ncbi:hypothetical protein J2Z62_000532 [Mycoplasmoides fastidiosum]|uniref:Uncharacterized protein n=1 Tax=Mycoplasmoides fastidiosum TaxID=92758 RepID=A0ABU0LZJ2_9BACT|nr:hypothetical protein [Mycoplasmoides fastidiosum]MDQ0514094.1 hypothetical protein [Mycoplasmoides fastidiosum]UUD37497.1 hypothetical protein NPA10_02920 [Mycoplasmoides fastidiosum]
MKKIAKQLFGSALFWFFGLSTGAGLIAQNQETNTQKNHSFSLANQKFQRHQEAQVTEAKTLTDDEVETLIKKALEQLHVAFERKFGQISQTYPRTESGRTNKAITYLLSRITDANEKQTTDYYAELVANLKTLITRNFNAPVFSSQQNKSGEDNIPFPSYKVELTNESRRGRNYWEHSYLVDNLVNTAGATQIRDLVNNLLNNWVTFLTSDSYSSGYDDDSNYPIQSYPLQSYSRSNDSFGMGWYNRIPNELKPHFIYNRSFDQTSYLNLVSALTTTKNNSSIITVATNLENLTKVLNTALNRQQTEDAAYLKQLNQNKDLTFTKLFQDNSISHLNDLIEQVDPQYKIGDASNFWNFNFSNADFITIDNKNYPGVELTYKKINYSSSYSNNPSFEYTLKYNNASGTFRTSHFPYRGSLVDGGSLILTTTLQLMTQKFSNFFELNKSVNLKSYDLILDKSNFHKTQIVEQLEKALPFTFEIKSVERVNPTAFGASQPKEFVFKINYVANLGNKAPFNWYVNFSNNHHAFLKIPNYAAIEQLEKAPELPPILDIDSLSKVNLGSLSDLLKDPKFLADSFSYQNFDSSFAYQAIQAVPTKNKLIVTTEIRLTGSELSKTYETELPINGLLDSEQLNNALQLIRDQIEQQLKNKYPDQYDYYMREENKWLRDQLLAQALEKTRLDPSFLTNNLEENIELFTQNFLEGFLDFFSQSNQEALSDEIHKHYQEIREKLIAVLRRLGISLDSDLAKILLNQINFEEHKSLEEGKIIPPSAELAAILDFLNDPDTNIDRLKEIAPILEKLNPYLLAKTFNTTQRVSLYTVSTLTFMMSLISSGFIWRVSRIDGQKFRLRKGIFLAIGITMLLLSLGGSGFLISLLAAS